MVTTNQRVIRYLGDGSNKNFPCPEMIRADDARVLLVDAGGNEIPLTVTTHYSVTGSGRDYTVVMVTAPAVGEKLVVYRETGRTRSTDYQANDSMNPGVLNDDFDRVVMVDQEQQEEISRSTAASIVEEEGYVIPGRDTMKGSYLMFDPDTGDPVPGPGPISRGNWSQYANYQTDDIVNYEGVFWLSLTDDNKNNTPVEGANWTKHHDQVHVANLDQLNDFRVWDPARPYVANDPVFFQGIPYRANSLDLPAAGESPATHPSKWEAVGGGGGTVGNICPDPSGAKGDAGWTETSTTVTTESTTLTGFATELKILAAGAGQAVWTIPVPVQLRGEELELRYEGFLQSGTPTIEVWGAAKLPFSGSIPATTGKFKSVGRFYSDGSANIEIRIIGSGTFDLRMTNIYLGRREVVYGAAIGPWTPYTPTFQGFGTPTNVDFRWRKNGESVEIMGRFTSGTPTAVEARVGLPGGLTSFSSLPVLSLVGLAARGIASAFYHYGTLIEPSKDYMCIGFQSGSATVLSKANADNVASSGNTVAIQASIPIAQWQGSGVVQLAENAGTLYLSNTESVANTNGVVGKSYYGIEGSPIVSNTAATYYDITLPRALQPDEVPVLEVRSKVDGNWIPIGDAVVPSVFCKLQQSRFTGSDTGSGEMNGLYLAKTQSGQLRVYASSRLVGFASFGVDVLPQSQSWSAITAAADGYDRWRVRIEKAGARQETPTVRAEMWLSADSAASSTVPIPYNQISVDTHGCLTAGAGAKFTVKVPGLYLITIDVFPTSSNVGMWIHLNGVAVRRIGWATNAEIRTQSAQIYLTSGDIDIRPGAGFTFGGSGDTVITARNRLTIARIGA